MDNETIFESPFFENEYLDEIHQSNISGGSIDTSSQIFLIILIVILTIVVLWVLIVVMRKIHILGEDYNQRQTRIHFNNIRGEDYDEEAQKAIEYGEAIENPRAIDHYRVGAVYLLNAGNHVAAHQHFNQALDQIIDGLVDTREAPFILGRIEDFNGQFIDMYDVTDLPLQQALQAHYRNQYDQLKKVPERKKNIIGGDDPEFKQKTLLARQDWQSDSQNVHDSAIYEELKEQVMSVIEENKKINNIELHGYPEVVNWLKIRFNNDPKLKDVEKIIYAIGNDNPIMSIPGIKEKDIITAVWQRSFDPDNVKNQLQIRESLGDAVVDCVERGSAVCISGRSSKIWQALARLDKNENIGILKSKQVLRNEIYQRSAKIVDDLVGLNGSASQALKEAYNKGENTEQVIELNECIKTRINEIALDYKGLINQDQIDSTIKECIAVI